MPAEPAPVRLTPPRAGGRIRLTPNASGGHTMKRLPLDDPLEGATDKERAFYLANYGGLTLAELLDRLRTAEWNVDHWKGMHDQLAETQKRYPPLYRIQEMGARHRRLKALLDRPGRISRVDLHGALAWADDRWADHIAQTDTEPTT